MNIQQLIATRPEWIQDAACKGLPAETFFPERHETHVAAKARAICASCPVMEQCATWAAATGEQDGIWGGRNRDGLRALRREMREAGIPTRQCHHCRKWFVAGPSNHVFCSHDCQRESDLVVEIPHFPDLTRARGISRATKETAA